MKPIVLFSLVLLLPLAMPHLRASDLQTRIIDASHILEKRQGSAHPIPARLFANARGVAIGSFFKAGLGIGGQGGEGIVIVRKGDPALHAWTAPSAWDLTGGSLGAQIGFSTVRFIIILNTEAAVRKFISNGKTRWDATASGTAGDDTATESESNRSLESRATIIYKETGGLFGGATFGGSSIELNNTINQVAYGPNIYIRDILEGRVLPPPNASRIYQLLEGQR